MDQEITEENELSSFDVLAIAVQVERNGIEFYRKAAALFADNSAGGLFNKLLQWEQTHVATFSRMRDDIAEKSWKRGTYRPDCVSIPQEQLLAGLAVFGVHPNPVEEFTGRETREEVLRAAIQKEKDAVVFYTGLKDLVFDPDEQSVVDDIIKEEVQHIRILSQALNQA
jgi:rubrerythrin